MATGRGTKLTGAVGEFLVAAELCRRGWVATPFAGNVPHYDIIASNEKGRHLAIQVKAISHNSSWQFDAKKFVAINMEGNRQRVGARLRPPYPNLFCVFVALGEDFQGDRYFVFSWEKLGELVHSSYQTYLDEHDGIRPKNPTSTHCSLNLEQLAMFEGRWGDLFAAAETGCNSE